MKTKMKFSSIFKLLSVVTLSLLFTDMSSFAQGKKLIRIDGSSTVYPLTEAIAEEFKKENKDINLAVGVSGTGGGFKKFINAEIEIIGASRKILDAEKSALEAKKIEYLELPVAYDGLTVAVSKGNTFANEITTDELKKLWEPGSKSSKWNEVNPKWPDQTIKLYGPGADSGTFDFFTETIMGKAKLSRSDYMASEDDNVIANGVNKDKNALAYFGYAYFLANKSKLKALGVQKSGSDKAIVPNETTIGDKSYPLSRELYIYVSKKELNRPEIKKFVEFYLENTPKVVTSVGYIPLPSKQYVELNQLVKRG